MVGPELLLAYTYILALVILKANKMLHTRYILRKLIDIIERYSCPVYFVITFRGKAICYAIDVICMTVKALEVRFKVNINGG